MKLTLYELKLAYVQVKNRNMKKLPESL